MVSTGSASGVSTTPCPGPIWVEPVLGQIPQQAVVAPSFAKTNQRRMDRAPGYVHEFRYPVDADPLFKHREAVVLEVLGSRAGKLRGAVSSVEAHGICGLVEP